MSASRIFVTGIGTDVGKTVAAAVITQALDADYWKPVQAGLDQTDTDTLRALVTRTGFRAHPEAYRLRAPMSPHAAAARENIEIRLDRIQTPATDRTLVIEGAGGLLVPLADGSRVVDLIVQLNAPVVVVSRHYLGSINHTLLTLEALRARDISLLGVLFVGEENPETEAAIRGASGDRILGRIPWAERLDAAWVTREAERLRPALVRALADASTETKGPPSEHTSPLKQTPAPNLSERDLKVIWHPYTQAQTADPPIGVLRGEGPWLHTEDGRRIFDGISSWWVNVHGHSHPEIARRVSEQLATLEHVIFSGFTHPPAVELAERLLAKLPHNQARIFYSDNGSTAVEVALKMAIQYRRNRGEPQRRILALEGGYHGDTFGAMAASARSAFTAPFDPYLFEVGHIPFPGLEFPGVEAEAESAALAALEKELARGDVAALIYEPLVQGAGGMRMYSPKTLSRMLELCRKAGAHTIADEVMTGFHRTGRFLASDCAELAPDLICLSKGLTGGTLPLGVTSCSREIFEAFLSDDRSRTFFHGHSFTGNPLACAASLASLDLLERPECQARIQAISAAHAAFASRLRDVPRFGALGARSQGTILALDFPGQGYLDPIGPRLYRRFLAQGLLLRPLGNTLYVLPPYCTTDADLRWIYECISTVLQDEINS